jgi:hypothetical protein
MATKIRSHTWAKLCSPELRRSESGALSTTVSAPNRSANPPKREPTGALFNNHESQVGRRVMTFVNRRRNK